jgi:hypothetical protein
MRAEVPFLTPEHTDKGKECHTRGAGDVSHTRASRGVGAT